MPSLAFLSQLISLVGVAFCIWMIIDCLRNAALEVSNKVLWLLFIFFGQPMFGALIYFAFDRSKQNKPPHQRQEAPQSIYQRSKHEPQPKDAYPE
jgi:hypothetical protein